MKISTDSVLIGAWTRVEGAKLILDIGTGSGVIALMLTQRCDARVHAIDIDPHAYEQAKNNFFHSKWKDRLTVFESSLQNFSPAHKYDVIVSNPPYFHLPHSHKEKKGAHAKYTHTLSFLELLEGVLRLLNPYGGCFYVILPVHEGTYFVNQAEQKNFYLTDYVWVKTTNQKILPKRILMKFECEKKSIVDNKLLVIKDENEYTEEYKELTKDYYLKF